MVTGQRRRKHAVVPTPPEVMARALSRWHLEAPTGCHVSTYSVGSHGYAQIGWHDNSIGRSRMVLCHRATWEAHHGIIPEGMTIDHLCRNSRCINIEHLRILPNLENARRTSGRDWLVDGGCIRGHSEDYWRPKSAARLKGYCSACAADDQRRYRGRKKLAA